MGPTRQSVLAQLDEPTPLRVLTGPLASGRSVLLRHLAQARDGRVTMRARGPFAGGDGLCRALLKSVGRKPPRLTPGNTTTLARQVVTDELDAGRRVVVQLDDADRLDGAAWTTIEELGATRVGDRCPELLLSLVRVHDGSSPAAAYVRRHDASNLAVVTWLRPGEVRAYLAWRFARFDLDGIATPAATRLIARITRGSFAAIDQICQAALLLVRSGQGERINVNVVYDAVQLLQRARRVDRVRAA